MVADSKIDAPHPKTTEVNVFFFCCCCYCWLIIEENKMERMKRSLYMHPCMLYVHECDMLSTAIIPFN